MPDPGSDDPTPAPHAVAAETHTAVIFMVGDRAYKLKKPVNLGFLDFSTRQRRRAACRREATLNRRIAPDVYLGVADVRGPDGGLCDHLVVMRRMPADRRLSTLARAGAATGDDLRALARLVAAFHASARRGPDISAAAGADAILGRWRDSVAQVRTAPGGPVIAEGTTDEIAELATAFLSGRGPLLRDRSAAGRIVDGHGDLLADDIYCLPDGPRVLDCIEFDDRLRWVDGLDDAAFLAMDLEFLGAADLGARFLDWYAEFAADPAPASLRHHYLAYRAFVRAKVDCLRHGQGGTGAAADAARHADLAASHLRAGAVALVLVGGLPGTGKSTLAGGIADRVGAVLLSTDRIRKELAGLVPEQAAGAPYREGIYSPEWTQRTYAELLSRTETLLGHGETVILDASWIRAADREVARAVATRTFSRLVEVRCDAAAEVISARLRDRVDSDIPHGMSDAEGRIAAAMAAQADRWPEATSVRTDGSPDRSTELVLALVRPDAAGTTQRDR